MGEVEERLEEWKEGLKVEIGQGKGLDLDRKRNRQPCLLCRGRIY